MPQTEIRCELKMSRCDEVLTRGYIKLNCPHARKLGGQWNLNQVLPHDCDEQLGMHVWLARLVYKTGVFDRVTGCKETI